MARKYVRKNSPEGVGRLEAGVKKLLAQLAAAEAVVADKRSKLDKLRALLPVQPVEADRTIPPHALDAIRQYVKESARPPTDETTADPLAESAELSPQDGMGAGRWA